MDLSVLWYLLIVVLFIGYFFLEGFDYGVGILLPFLGKNDTERRLLVNSIGPFWDGNEVWLLTAGGAIFAAFPHWYATLFSGFYLPLFLIVVALMVRGVAFEFRSKDSRPGWRNLWDWLLFAGSLIPALLWGVALTNLLKGVPINAQMQYTGGFWNLLTPYTLIGGLTWLMLFVLHGALFLRLRTEGALLERAQRTGLIMGMVAIPLLVLLAVGSYLQTDLFARPGAWIALLLAIVTLLLTLGLLRSGKDAGAFITNGLTIILTTVAIFTGLFPRVMVSSLNPQWSLTIGRVASSPYTLKVMTIVAIVLVPVVLLYQAWTYWIFRQRVTTRHLEY